LKIKPTFSAVVEVLVISIEIGSLCGIADGSSVGAELDAWDGSSSPK